MGLCFGSFINVVIYRLNNEDSPFAGRSYCPKCKHKLSWYDLFPLISFLSLAGKCRYCHKKISWQYPIVEFVIGLLAVFLWVYEIRDFNYFIGFVVVLKYFLLFSIFSSLFVIFVSDILYMTVPTIPLIFSFISSLFYLFLTGSFSFINIISSIVCFLFFLFLYLITKGRGMGFGDVLLALFMGMFLGYPNVIISFYIAFLTGAFFGVILILIKKKRFGEHIAFGPFLIFGIFIAFFYGNILWRILLNALSLDIL